MAGQWQGSDRRDRLPPDWQKRRADVMRRAGRKCEHEYRGERCSWKATDVDHVVPGDDHELDNLQALCSWHHARKSSREGNAAKAVKRQATAQKFSRTEDHPGLL